MINNNIKNGVVVVQDVDLYPSFPYEINSDLFKSMKDLFEGLGLSRENPFSDYIKPQQTVLIKPNWVRDFNPNGHNLDSLITHTSIIKYLIDFLLIAMEGRGKIVIADAPLQNCNFNNLKSITKIQEVVNLYSEKYPKMIFCIEDWRITTSKGDGYSQEFKFSEQEALKKGYIVFDMREDSFLEEISDKAERFRVTKYKPSLMLNHHKRGKHEYLVTDRIFEADFIINVPKLKTHIKAGLTGALKNLIGINGHKEFLPHHIKGSFFDGGDNYYSRSWFKSKYEDLYDYVWENNNEFSYFKQKILMKILDILWKLSIISGTENISAGSWYGNNTIWRTTLDLNHILYFGKEKPLKVLNIVDGIIAGEGQGPLEPTPKNLGFLIAGENPAQVDSVIAKIIGYTLKKVPTVYNAIYNKKSRFNNDLESMDINLCNKDIIKKIKFSELPIHSFKKPEFWKEN